jgi:ribosomal-protein-alanine N-acetyltransferase
MIRRAQETDIATIQELEEEAFGTTWDRATFLKELLRENGCTVVAEEEGRTVGAALLVWAADEVQLNSIVIDKAWRGRGLSSQFLGGLMSWCQSRRFSWMTLEVKWQNRPAHALYRKFGFVTTARRPSYYSDGQDARLMWAGHLDSPHYRKLLSDYEPPESMDKEHRS